MQFSLMLLQSITNPCKVILIQFSLMLQQPVTIPAKLY